VPDQRAVFSGDLVFVGVTPIMWVGPVENWIRALDRIVELEPRTVVPGHGPTTNLEGVRAMRAYWEYVAAAVRERLASGLEPYAAARDIVRSREFAEHPFAEWDARERIVINAAIIARSDRGEGGRVSEQARVRLLANMGELGAELG
jgi:glyoxylase-like metal-dependent hydrolase (beta-lactamase superfamily II)